jgi:DIE2/ALG10 family
MEGCGTLPHRTRLLVRGVPGSVDCITDILLADIPRILIDLPKILPEILPSFVPYFLVLLAFGAFVIWNGGIVLGM